MGLFDRFKKDQEKSSPAEPPPKASRSDVRPDLPIDDVRERLAKKIVASAAESRALFRKLLGGAFDGLQRPYIDFRSWRGVEVQLEFLYLYLILTDRIARGRLGEETGVDFAKPLVQRAMTTTLEAVLIDETDPKAQASLRTRAFNDLNAAAEEYAPFNQVLPSAPGNYKDSVVGHFAKRLASNLGTILDSGVMNTSMDLAKKGLATIRIEEQIERIME